jgi:hypothetical protein
MFIERKQKLGSDLAIGLGMADRGLEQISAVSVQQPLVGVTVRRPQRMAMP